MRGGGGWVRREGSDGLMWCVEVVLLECGRRLYVFFFFFNDTATTEIYTLSLHDALPIWAEPRSSAQLLLCMRWGQQRGGTPKQRPDFAVHEVVAADRKSTRLNSSHRCISYAVFCLKKKKKKTYLK